MLVEDFDYNLPEELIAQDPIEPRDASRLLILNKCNGTIRHSIFSEIGAELNAGDILVINDTRVLPARIYATTDSNALVEVLLLKQVSLNSWEALTRPGKKAKIGCNLSFALPEITAKVVDYGDEGSRIIEFYHDGDFFSILERLGEMPLPPYIKKKLINQERYQPVYARERGSAAAPTAGLHFTNALLEQLQQQAILIEKILLHVGLGTFRPVKTEVVEEHFMHSEYYRVSAESAARINQARQAGGRVIAVGTTSVRTLESVSADDGTLSQAEGWTNKYIYPGYQFKIVDGMITNFHLPKSTLIMLISALAGRENVLNAYQEAINCRYRFYSFGDAMLII